MLRVFVYGTLKPGQENYDRYCRDRVSCVQAAYTFGQLYALPIGYPALTIAGTEGAHTARDNRVWGHLLTFTNPAILSTLDELEDFDPRRSRDDNEYERQQVPVFDPMQRALGFAWAYVMLPHWIRAAEGVYRPHGCWP